MVGVVVSKNKNMNCVWYYKCIGIHATHTFWV